MRIGIVGHEGAKFTQEGEIKAKSEINDILRAHLQSVFVEKFGKPVLVSGHSPLGGIDIWAEERAKELGAYDRNYIFTPKQNKWKDVEYGFRSRNIDIAVASEGMYVFVVNEFAPTYIPKKFDGYCYHCKTYDHKKSGACFTGKVFEKIWGKKANWIIIDQGHPIAL